eukprot:jgi/Psemu1/1475/gm1.1475_g
MPTPPSLTFLPAITLPGEAGLSGGCGSGSGMAAQQAQLCMGAIGSPFKFYAAPCRTCAVAKHRATKFNLEPMAASASGTYLFVKTKPGVLSATVCLLVEAHHTFDQWEAVFRTVLPAFKDSTGDKTRLPFGVQDVLKASKPKLELIKTQLPTLKALDPMNPTGMKAAFTALAGQLKDEMKVKELDLSSVDLQLVTIKLIIGQQNSDYLGTLMNTNARLTEDLGKLKSQPPALAKAKQDKFFKACSTQTPGDMLLDRITKLESALMPMLGLSHFNSLSIIPPTKSVDTADLQTWLKTLEAQFTYFWEESKNTKVRLVNTYFTSWTDMGAWCTLYYFPSESSPLRI